MSIIPQFFKKQFTQPEEEKKRKEMSYQVMERRRGTLNAYD